MSATIRLDPDQGLIPIKLDLIDWSNNSFRIAEQHNNLYLENSLEIGITAIGLTFLPNYHINDLTKTNDIQYPIETMRITGTNTIDLSPSDQEIDDICNKVGALCTRQRHLTTITFSTDVVFPQHIFFELHGLTKPLSQNGYTINQLTRGENQVAVDGTFQTNDTLQIDERFPSFILGRNRLIALHLSEFLPYQHPVDDATAKSDKASIYSFTASPSGALITKDDLQSNRVNCTRSANPQRLTYYDVNFQREVHPYITKGYISLVYKNTV